MDRVGLLWGGRAEMLRKSHIVYSGIQGKHKTEAGQGQHRVTLILHMPSTKQQCSITGDGQEHGDGVLSSRYIGHPKLRMEHKH